MTPQTIFLFLSTDHDVRIDLENRAGDFLWAGEKWDGRWVEMGSGEKTRAMPATRTTTRTTRTGHPTAGYSGLLLLVVPSSPQIGSLVRRCGYNQTIYVNHYVNHLC